MVWYEDKHVVIEGVNDNECIATNKIDKEIFLIFDKDLPLGEYAILPHETKRITDEDLIERIKAKEMRTLSFVIKMGGNNMKK